MSRFSTFAVLAALGLALFTATAAAQRQPPQWTPAYVPPNPLYALTPYQYQLNIGVTIPTTYGRAFVGMTAPFTPAPQYFSPNYGRSYTLPWMPPGGTYQGYMYGGSASSYYTTAGQRDVYKAQQAAGQMRNYPEAAKKAINDQVAYEKSGVIEPAGGKPPANAPGALERALAGADEQEVTSGEALNRILGAVVAAEATGAKGASAYLPPRLLDDIRFATPAGDALNLIRIWNRLPFPPALAAPELADLRDALEKDFAAAVTPVLTGKPVDPVRVTRLEQTLKRVEEAAAPVIRNLSFEDAIASRKFLNQFANAVRALKAGGSAGLFVSTWATEGANVSELVKHMAKYKLQFAPAPPGAEPTYLVLHRALVGYYFILTQPKK